MHLSKEVGAFSLCGFSDVFYPGDGGEGIVLE